MRTGLTTRRSYNSVTLAGLVPVRVEGCKPEGLLKSIVYIDLVGLDEAAARAALLRGVVPGRAKPETVPFPSGGTPLVHGPRFPGAASTHPQAHFTPSIQKPRNLPYASLGRLFKGRESFIETLHAALSGSRDGWAAVIGKAVHGLGGVGKR